MWNYPCRIDVEASKMWPLDIIWETFFSENHSQNGVEKLFPDLFLKNQNQGYLWINSDKFSTVYMPNWGLSKYIEIKLQSICYYLKWSLWKKNQEEICNQSSSLIFCMIFEKMLLLLCYINWPNFIAWLPVLYEILNNMCIATIY